MKLLAISMMETSEGYAFKMYWKFLKKILKHSWFDNVLTFWQFLVQPNLTTFSFLVFPDIKQKLDKLNDLWENIQKLAHKRGRSLEDALAAAERFWDELTMVMKTLNELQESLNAQEPPAVEPNAIQHQQDVLQVSWEAFEVFFPLINIKKCVK